MPALPGVPRTWTAGEYPTAAMFNAEIKDSLNFLANPPACRVYHTATQSIANTALVALAFGSERLKTVGYASMHDNVTNNSRITIVTPGVYVVAGSVAFGSNNLGFRYIELSLNGVTPIAVVRQPAVQGDYTDLALSTPYKFGAGDFVTLRAYQNSGAAVNVMPMLNSSPEFSAVWVGKG